MKRKKIRWALSLTGGRFQAAARDEEPQGASWCATVLEVGGWRSGRTKQLKAAGETIVATRYTEKRTLNSAEEHSSLGLHFKVWMWEKFLEAEERTNWKELAEKRD